MVAPDVVRLFLRWFAARGDVYARQWFDARKDRGGYWPVREPLNARVAEAHLLGRTTVGQYVLHPDDTVSFAALDLDPTAAALEELRLGDASAGPLALGPMRDYAVRLLRAARDASLGALPEDTGGDGVHLWWFFAPRIPAARARAMLREILFRAGPQPPAVNVELFPKQDQLTGKGWGNLIKLPLGLHQKTLRASRLLDQDLRPVDGGSGLVSIHPVEPAALQQLLNERVVPIEEARAAREGRPIAASAPPLNPPTGPSPRALAVALASVPPAETAAAVDRILAGCVVLRELSRRAIEEHQLPAAAARALLFSVGIVGRENALIEEFFAQAGVGRRELDRVRRGLQGPVGCRRLREMLPGPCAECRGPAVPEGGYATPALYAFCSPPSFRRPPSEIPAPEGLSAESSDPAIVEIDKRLARIEATLVQLVSNAESGGPKAE
jgi:hypothetical protein